MDNSLRIKQNRLILAARIRFTHKCLMKLALNNAVLGDKLAPSAEFHPLNLPICINLKLN